jgi:hypothetical protein
VAASCWAAIRFAQWNEEQFEKILRDRVFDICARGRAIGKAKAGEKVWIAEQAGLDQICLRNPRFLQSAPGDRDY